MRTLQCTLLLAASVAVCLPAAQTTDATGQNQIGPAIRMIEPYIEEGMKKTGVPGLAVAVVYRDRVVYLKGFGFRKAGETARINADTVFQLASVSKPIASTIIASLVGRHEVEWDDRIAVLDPQFKLSDPAVSAQVTIRDLLSHRSGLPTSAGDALEDLGFSRPVILHQMRLIPLVGTFRQSYAYSNFGFTEGAIAAAKVVRQQWEDLAERRLFRPLGMDSTSYRYSDYEAHINKAAIHTIIDGEPIARYKRIPDAEAPAGSASSSVRDLAQWLRLQLGNGTYNGQPLIAPDALDETHKLQSHADPTGQNGYGLGWNVNHDAKGNLILGHSGAFFLGVGTTVRFSPSDQLGIIVLTNALPTGLAEAVSLTFFDYFKNGRSDTDWLSLAAAQFKKDIEDSNNATTDYSKQAPPSSPAPPKPDSAYVGIYSNDYYGQIEISEMHGQLWMRLPRTGALYTLTHWDGDMFIYRFEAEQGIGDRGVTFSFNGQPQVKIDNLALEGNGVFLKQMK